MPETPKLTLRQLFEKLPIEIRIWLTSEEATYVTMDINRRLGLEDTFTAVIPRAVTRLVTGDLQAKQFITELSNGLDIKWEAAQGVAQEIERRVLRPVEVALRNKANIDIKMIYQAQPPTSPSNTPLVPSTTLPRPTTLPASPFIYRPSQVPTPTIPPKPVTPQVAPQPGIPSAPKEIPVKINVNPTPLKNPGTGEQPFGPDSWVNKVK